MFNKSVEEFAKYECTDSGASEIIFNLLDQLEAKEEENKQKFERYDRDLEITREQVYFASTLVKDIERVVKRETRARDIKDKISLLLEQTMFEA